jgi:hypothetical protein
MGPVEPIVPTQGVGAGVGICCDKCGSYTLLNKADPERRGYCMANGAAAVVGTPCLPWVQIELHNYLETVATLKHRIRLVLPQLAHATESLQDAIEESES